MHPKEKVLKSKSYTYAVHYLSRYPKTRKELEMKLLQKWFSYEDIKETIDTLAIQNIVDDAKFADSYIYSECVKKGKPLFVIKKKLLFKGIDKAILDNVCSQYENDIEEGILQKIIKDIENYKKRGVEWLDIVQKLMRKGYSADQIKSAVQLRESQNT
jgi:regulatory protein